MATTQSAVTTEQFERIDERRRQRVREALAEQLVGVQLNHDSEQTGRIISVVEKALDKELAARPDLDVGPDLESWVQEKLADLEYAIDQANAKKREVAAPELRAVWG